MKKKFMQFPARMVDILAESEMLLVVGGASGSGGVNNSNGTCEGTNNDNGLCTETNNGTGRCYSNVNNGKGLCRPNFDRPIGDGDIDIKVP